MQRIAYIGIFAMLAQCRNPAYQAKHTTAESREAFRKRLSDFVFRPALQQVDEKAWKGVFRAMYASNQKTPLTRRLLDKCPDKEGSLKESDQQQLIKTYREAAGRNGYLLVLEITNEQSNIQAKELYNFVNPKTILL